MGIDPRRRTRVEVVPVVPTVSRHVRNGELLESWKRAMKGKLAASTVENYEGTLRDAFLFFSGPEGERPVRTWTKADLWSYIHFVEANYCARFLTPWGGDGACCRARVWVGLKPVAEATEICRTCPRFKRPYTQHRVNALSKFFKYLAKVGAVEHNIMRDVVSEYFEDAAPTGDNSERRRNPSVEEVVRLVNDTAHPQRRFLYALLAKTRVRLNEAFALDRYASFGLRTPAGMDVPQGFARGFAAHAVPSFEEGGCLPTFRKRWTSRAPRSRTSGRATAGWFSTRS